MLLMKLFSNSLTLISLSEELEIVEMVNTMEYKGLKHALILNLISLKHRLTHSHSQPDTHLTQEQNKQFLRLSLQQQISHNLLLWKRFFL